MFCATVLTVYAWQHCRKKQPPHYSQCVLQHTKASGQGDSQNHVRAGKKLPEMMCKDE